MTTPEGNKSLMENGRHVTVGGQEEPRLDDPYRIRAVDEIPAYDVR
jgi:hypothetical protein